LIVKNSIGYLDILILVNKDIDAEFIV